jgi:hypothetical protein
LHNPRELVALSDAEHLALLQKDGVQPGDVAPIHALNMNHNSRGVANTSSPLLDARALTVKVETAH